MLDGCDHTLLEDILSSLLIRGKTFFECDIFVHTIYLLAYYGESDIPAYLTDILMDSDLPPIVPSTERQQRKESVYDFALHHLSDSGPSIDWPLFPPHPDMLSWLPVEDHDLL